MFLRDNGAVYSCGGDGRLGFDDSTRRQVPERIFLEMCQSNIAISCGYEHTLFLTDNNSYMVVEKILMDNSV